MATTVKELEEAIQTAITPGFRHKLLAQGQARSIIWRDGKIPQDAPAFSYSLNYDLLSYGYSLLSSAIRLREADRNNPLLRQAFEQAASALEAVIVNGSTRSKHRNFHYIITAATYHLGHYSARAYSLLSGIATDENSLIERALALLILRDLEGLEKFTKGWLLKERGSDQAILELFEAKASESEEAPYKNEESHYIFEGINVALVDVFFKAIANFLLALEQGKETLLEAAAANLKLGLSACSELNLIPQWWVFRITDHLIQDLWDASLHKRLPLIPTISHAQEWHDIRQIFIASLYRRSKAEIDLWPSQIVAASRAINETDDLVVSLPTSAGKTRIAELCILRCLSIGKRVVFVTPLRALSAQTEVSLTRTFGPLGTTISSLYGSMGTNAYDQDALRQHDIVVATPEKLDFSLRNDPTLLDDVGLIILDEGHMIGEGDREVRYEAQIQRLLKRQDADQRRIVCLSAILPEGDQLDDFVAWIRRDREDGLIKNDWRPTRIRFGEVVWKNNSGQLNLRVGDERPYVPKYITLKKPTAGKRKAPFPRDQQELTLATTWKLVSEGHSALIYCPLRRSILPFAKTIIDLHNRGFLPSVITPEGIAALESAMVLGREWLGVNHPILQCLSLGVVIHHGTLPTAYRKEVEKLLREGILKVTISSPTLAQGLNLTATAVIMHSLHRSGERLKGSEFKNVIGRAGRAYIDLEGLAIHPIFEDHRKRQRDWEELISEAGIKDMESGILWTVYRLFYRISTQLNVPNPEHFIEYVMNNAAAWTFVKSASESPEDAAAAEKSWAQHTASLDTAILSLLGEQEIALADIATMLDEILNSSFWERRIVRAREELKASIKSTLHSRARYLWSHTTSIQRRGYFLAGVGLATGQLLDNISGAAEELLIQANAGVMTSNADLAVDSLTSLAEMLFSISPFTPDKLPQNWKLILKGWLKGEPITAISQGDDDILRFIEDAFVYRLPWGMEAIRVRGLANNSTHGDFNLEDFELGLAVGAVETGTLNIPAAILLRAGFASRVTAIKIVEDTGADFGSYGELSEWLKSDRISELSQSNAWPTIETAALWNNFRNGFQTAAQKVWQREEITIPYSENKGTPASLNQSIRLVNGKKGMLVMGPDWQAIGITQTTLNPHRRGLTIATVNDKASLHIEYLGPQDLFVEV